MNRKRRSALWFFIGAMLTFLILTLIQTGGRVNTEETSSETYSARAVEIDELTDQHRVASYIVTHGVLPPYYLTKEQARSQGWDPSKENLCEVLPGRAIGGDRFFNRERLLPTGINYYEADIDYHCGRRNASRLVYSKRGDFYITKDHYKSFEKLKPIK